MYSNIFLSLRSEMAMMMMMIKPLLRTCDLQKDVIYTIQKKTSIGPYCEIELEDVRIKVPVYVNSFQKDFIKYNGHTVEFLHPTHMYCFCEEWCEKCGCKLEPVVGLCMCTFEFGNIVIYDFDRYIEKVDELLDNPNIWCWGCFKYVWDWDVNHIECGLEYT